GDADAPAGGARLQHVDPGLPQPGRPQLHVTALGLGHLVEGGGPRRLALDRGRQGPANRLAVAGLKRLEAETIDTLFQRGLHEFLLQFIADNNALGDAIAEQHLF
ncbi:MAG: alpha-E domain-containing protein, partial [Thermaurantiacus tibetensis]